MKKMLKLVLIFVLVFFLMNLRLSVEGTEINEADNALQQSLGKYEQQEVVRGAIEDLSWMKAGSKEDLNRILSRYYEGYLLDDLTGETWKSIEQPTDWYCRARLIDMVIMYDDGSRALAETLIGIEDLETGHNDLGRGTFGLIKKKEGWRINYSAYCWGNEYDKR